MTRFALVSHVLPPSWSGQAVMLRRVLGGLDPDSYVLVDTRPGANAEAGSGALAARRYELRRPRWAAGRSRRGLGRLQSATLVASRVVSLVRILRSERCDAVVACTGDLWDLPTAYAAGRMLGLPFHPYCFDDYSTQWPAGAMRAIAARLEPRLMHGAATPIVPNEFLAEALAARYGVECAVVHNPVDLEEFDRAEARRLGAPSVVFTGTAYGAQADALRNLIEALPLLPGARPRLHVFGPTPREELASLGVDGPDVVAHELEPASAIPSVQKGADVLFLPLAFRSAYSKELIRTSAPGKLGDYLAAGRPILAHVPADCYVAWYLRTHDCGVVVSDKDPRALAHALGDLLGNVALRERLVQNARARARADFSVAESQRRLVAALEPRPAV
ncbi:MAG: glycosyltransferase [Gaiellaceae bacterium]